MDWLSPGMRESPGFVSLFLSTTLRAVISFILVFFLPGFTWSLVIFLCLNVIERLAVSLAGSIVVVTLSLLLANRVIGVRITGFSAALVIGVVTILPLVIYYLNRLASGGKSTNPDQREIEEQ